MTGVAVVADAHLGGPGGAAGELVAQLDRLEPASCERLVLLGDLFQAWIGSPRFETLDIREIVAALERLGERGVPVDYIEGNRDFFLAGSVYSKSLRSVGTELAFDHAGVRYLVVHGDGLNARDYLYRFWRRISKNPVTRWAMFGLPRALAQYLVDRMERSLSKTNFKHKSEIPEDVLKRYGERRLAEGHDVLLLGHFHEARNWRVAGGEVRILDAWFETRRIEWLG